MIDRMVRMVHLGLVVSLPQLDLLDLMSTARCLRNYALGNRFANISRTVAAAVAAAVADATHCAKWIGGSGAGDECVACASLIVFASRLQVYFLASEQRREAAIIATMA